MGKPSDGAVAYWTPGGIINPFAQRVELTAAEGIWFDQFEDVAQALHLGAHCTLPKCDGDLIAKNSKSDVTKGLACGCRIFQIRPTASSAPRVAKKGRRHELGVGGWLREFQTMLHQHRLALYCSLCRGDLATASDSEHVFSVKCRCSERTWTRAKPRVIH